MSIYTGDVGGNGTAFGPLSWNTQTNAFATGNFYAWPLSDAPPDTVEYFQIVAGTGTYTTLQAVSGVALSTDSLTYTIRKNGSDTGLTVTLAAGTTYAVASGSVSVMAGDRISLKVVQSGTESTAARNGIGLH